MINELSKKIHEANREKGFYDNPNNMGEMLMLIVTEVSEACEAHREDRYTKSTDLEWALSTNDDSHFYHEHFPEKIKNTFEDELADIMIRTMDIAGFLGIDLEAHIAAKMRYNALRPHKHGKKY